MKAKSIVLFLLIYLQVSAQNIENTLGTNGDFIIKDAANTYLTLKQSSGLLGIGSGVTTPRAQLEIGGTDGLLVTGTANSGTIRALGAGVRMQWYPRKGAFRVGCAETSWWDDDGTANPKLALYSIAMGYQPRASAVASTAIGAYNKATGDYSLALGSYSQASASHSVAIGTQVYASGIYSVAMGAGANTNGKDGAFVFGDDAYFQTAYSAQDNSMTMRFIGGYRLWSSYPDSTAGVYMRHGQSGWSNYCNRNLKENFEAVDGEMILEKIKSIPITKWNYKADEGKEKYIGPMAQDFCSAFQLNGTDSLGINSISIDGVNMAGVQALEKRTAAMQRQIEIVKKQNDELIKENKSLKEQFSFIDNLKDELAEVVKLKQELSKKLEWLEIVSGKEEEKDKQFTASVKLSVDGR